jgi:hypothetical protein
VGLAAIERCIDLGMHCLAGARLVAQFALPDSS